ncbi:chloride channel protein [Massilia sp. H-1]|nr:chloride channel protein [Massilia sp. H-1]
MFAIEELARTPEKRSSGLIIAAIVLAWRVIAVSVHGNGTYFGVIHAAPVGLALLGPGLALALLCGLVGGVFSRLLLACLGGQGRDRASALRRTRPVLFAFLCGAAVALIGVISHGTTFGSGYGVTRAMIDGSGPAPPIYALLKFCATWLTTWARRVRPGVFAPALAIGAAIGNDVALLVQQAHAPTPDRARHGGLHGGRDPGPLTSFIIVMEMVDGHAMVLSLMACALVARAVARLISPPLYPGLARMQLQA